MNNNTLQQQLAQDSALANFGKGWMSKDAADLCRIMIFAGNLDVFAFMKALPYGNRAKINIRSVERALAKLRTA